MWLVLSHLNLVHFFDLSFESLELLCEFFFFHLSPHGLLPECIQYLHCHLIIDHLCAICLSLCHVLICVFHLRNDLCFPLLELFHLSLELLLLCLHDYELCLQFLHILRSFDVLSDWNCLLSLLEVLDSCSYPFFFLVPLLDLLILF
jgi:hypothetical protein